MSKHITLAFLLCLAGITCLAQPSSNKIKIRYDQASKKVDKSFRLLSDTVSTRARNDATNSFASVAARLDKVGMLLSGCLKTLDSARNSNGADSLIVRYATEFENYAALMELVSSQNSADSINAILDFINEDLNLKYDGAYSAYGTAPDLVLVRVRVLNQSSSQDLAGYNVFLKPERSVDALLVESFNPTNNAVKRVLPGKKLVWIEKNGVKIDERKTGIRRSSNAEEPIIFVINE